MLMENVALFTVNGNGVGSGAGMGGTTLMVTEAGEGIAHVGILGCRRVSAVFA